MNDTTTEITALMEAIARQGDLVKALKAQQAAPETVRPEVEKLLEMKERFRQLRGDANERVFYR